MTPGVLPGIADDRSLEKQMEKQMGCMAGLLQLFDRHQILAGKRVYSAKRLTPSSSFDSVSEKSVGYPALSAELKPPPPQQTPLNEAEFNKQPAAMVAALDHKPSPSPEIRSPLPDLLASADVAARMPVALPVLDFKESLRSSWKLKEAPRLSLDSRAVVDGKGSFYPKEIRTVPAIAEESNDKQRRSPGVVARLMGLEALPNCGSELLKKAELRRSASESRASRDLRFIDGNAFQIRQTPPQLPNSGAFRRNVIQENVIPEERPKAQGGKSLGPKPSSWNAKKSFDSQDFFPEPRRAGSIYGEFERRLKLRGVDVDEPAKDLETLKHIMEALQLKGLLHSKKSEDSRWNFIYDRQAVIDSPIVVMKPSRSATPPAKIRCVSLSSITKPKSAASAITRNFVADTIPPLPSRRERADIDRNLQNERKMRNVRRAAESNESSSSSSAKSPSSLARRRATNAAGISPNKKAKDFSSNSLRIGVKKIGSDASKSPRNGKQTAEFSPRERFSHAHMDDESSTISEGSISASSQTDSDKNKADEYKEGRSLLERCDKLLHSIAEMTSAGEQQPSPVSVLDSSFYKDDGYPSPDMKRRSDFKAVQEEEQQSPAISPVRSKPQEASDDQDFLYTSEILRCHSRAPAACQAPADLFEFLEKHHRYSRASRLYRQALFDAVSEILDSKRQFSPWNAFCRSRSPLIVVDGPALLRQVWSELQRLRERTVDDDLCTVINGVVGRDLNGEMAAEGGWGDRSSDMSDLVLDIERLVFKDLVGETIRDLAAFSGKPMGAAPRRKLMF